MEEPTEDPALSGAGEFGGGAAQQDGVLAALSGAMDPDHPLLQRAQRALKQQLETKHAALRGELKEKQNAMKVRACALASHADMGNDASRAPHAGGPAAPGSAKLVSA